jgi:hypothetical protein
MEAHDSRMRAALDPRRKIYRDAFNEMFVFALSSTGAAVLMPSLLLLIGALTEELAFLPFVALSAAGELFLIFGIGRPQMKPLERVGWAALWGFAAIVFGAAFWELVYTRVL